MEITEVRITLLPSQKDHLKAFCSMMLDNEFAVGDIKIIERADGLFVAMPSRKISDHCSKCRGKNHLQARFCNQCGAKLPENRAKHDPDGRVKLHADIAHPTNAHFRQKIQETILSEFQKEVERSKQPGYKPRDMNTPEN